MLNLEAGTYWMAEVDVRFKVSLGNFMIVAINSDTELQLNYKQDRSLVTLARVTRYYSDGTSYTYPKGGGEAHTAAFGLDTFHQISKSQYTCLSILFSTNWE